MTTESTSADEADRRDGSRLSEGLGPLAQPSNDELRAALAAARAEDDSNAFHDDAKFQALWALREQRTTWFDTDEISLMRELDRFLESVWVTNSQHRLCEQYGATVFGDRGPNGRGYVWATWSDGAELRFHITTPLQQLHKRLSALCNRGSIEEDLRDLLTAACGPNVI